MEKNKIDSIRKELLKKKKFSKNEIRRMILKSIIQNCSIKPLIRVKASKIQQMRSKIRFISKQKNNICIKTGRIKGVYNTFNFSRHYIKFLGINNNLQNIKIASW